VGTISCGFVVLLKKMRVAQSMRVKQKVYTNNHRENGSRSNDAADHECRSLEKSSPKKSRAPILDSIPGIVHGCRLSTNEVA